MAKDRKESLDHRAGLNPKFTYEGGVFNLPYFPLLRATADDFNGAAHWKYFAEAVTPGAGKLTMDFVTLGMAIIDEIHFPDSRPSVHDVIGGAGLYALCGARLFRPENSHLVGAVVHVGHDFPDAVRSELENWECSIHWIDTPERATTRGWNYYRDGNMREFQYTTPKRRIDETQLSERQLLAKTFHFICSAERCIALVTGILQARKDIMNEVERKSYQRPIDNLTDFRKVAKPMDPPFFVWEPVPDSCVKSELQNVKAALKLVDVFSPNHLELAALFGEEERNIFLKSELEMLRAQCNELLTDGFGKKPSAVVVRRGDLGCYVATDIRHSWYPAYYSKEVLGFQASDNVKDPTGGGNAFLGAYCIGLITDHGEGQCQFEMAAHYGSVAASFAIQQHGVPHLTHLADREYWNKDSVQERLSKCIKAGYSPPMRMEKVEPTEPYTSEGFDMNGIKYSRIVRK